MKAIQYALAFVTFVACLSFLLLARSAEERESKGTAVKATESAKPLIHLPAEKIAIKKWIEQNDWQSARDDPRNFEIGDGRLHLLSRGDSVMIGTKKGFPLDPREWPRIRIELRVDKNPAGMDLSKKSRDDAAFRVYIAFDRGGGIFSPPHTLAYSWTENVEPGKAIQSAHFKQLRYLSIGRGVTTGAKDAGAKEKQDEKDLATTTVIRNIVEDYRRLFPEDKKAVPPIVGIMLKCDSNNTETSAEAWLYALELLSSSQGG